MQCKDIPDKAILEHLYKFRGEWCNWIFGDEKDVRNAMPDGTPDNLVLAKMKKLVNRGLVGGCACGCRGDFEITQKGIEFLEKNIKLD